MPKMPGNCHFVSSCRDLRLRPVTPWLAAGVLFGCGLIGSASRAAAVVPGDVAGMGLAAAAGETADGCSGSGGRGSTPPVRVVSARPQGVAPAAYRQAAALGAGDGDGTPTGAAAEPPATGAPASGAGGTGSSAASGGASASGSSAGGAGGAASGGSSTGGAASGGAAQDAVKPGEEYLAQSAALQRDPVGTRLIDINTPYTSGARWLEFLVTHRFIQPVNQGGTGHNLWGLDSGADVGIGFTYGVLQHLDVSVYRSEFQEDYELAAKYQFLQQAPGMPLSLAVRAGYDLLGRAGVDNPRRPFAQLLLARRFAPGFNLFVSPSWVEYTPLLHNAWNTPVGITVPLPGHWLIEAEGIAANRGLRDMPGTSQFGWHVAFTKPIGWHVFQILIGDSRATTVDQIIGGDFAGGFTTHDVRLGFNLIRYFNL